MSTIQITKNSQKTISAKIPSETTEQLDLFLKFKQQELGDSKIDMNDILDGVIKFALSKDSGFKAWLKERQKVSKSGASTSPKS